MKGSGTEKRLRGDTNARVEEKVAQSAGWFYPTSVHFGPDKVEECFK